MTINMSSSHNPLIGRVQLLKGLVASFLLFCGAVWVSCPISAAEREIPPFPYVRIPRYVRSENAIRALSNRLPAVAAWYGKKPEELTELLRRDRTLWVSPTGRLLHICELETPLETGSGDGEASWTYQAVEYPLELSLMLHSNPNSSKVIYLDFNGEVISGTAWNSGFNYGADIVAEPFDIDGNPSSFNATELERIQKIWQRVAEDYAIFDVDVTTEEPDYEDLTRSDNADTNYGIRVMITPTNFYLNAGGVSYVGVFDDLRETYKTSWVFSNMLNNGEKYIAEACSHESGHALGLTHDGEIGGSAYYAGHGNWAPLMGSPFSKEVTQWSKGEYEDANNTQDDLLVMQNYGMAYYADEHGNNADDATILPGPIDINSYGFIERNSDVDFFKFLTGSGNISISINPAPLGPNLDIQAELLDSNLNPILLSDPVGLSSHIETVIPAGMYYLAISGTGAGDPLITGYSDYGSLGQYTLSGTIVDPGSVSFPAAVAAALNSTSGNKPLSVNFSSAGSEDPDGFITAYLWNFGDGSPTSGEQNPIHIYNSTGTFIATLTVTDNDNLTSSDSLTISVYSELQVASIILTPQTSPTSVSVTAAVIIKDLMGNPVTDAAVTGTWSGVVQGTSTKSTSSGGSVIFQSPASSTSGTFTFTITNVSEPNYVFNPSSQSQTSDSITVTLPQDPLGAPSHLRASKSRSGINLFWDDNSSIETGFHIERRLRGAAEFNRIASVEKNIAYFSDRGVSKTIFYEYRVQAYNSEDTSAYTNTVIVRAR